MASSPSASSIATWMVAPRPVRSLSYSAVRTPLNAYMPVAMSAIEIPALDGTSGVPVDITRPVSHWTSRSYAFFMP